MPVELGSFDVIIGMDWLRRCHAVIVCDEKLVRVPYGNETLIFCGNESNDGRESRLTIISCSKAQEYMAKGCQIFLAQISAKKEEDKSEGKQLKDVPIVRDFPEVFPEDLPGLPPARPVEFQIDLIPGAAPVKFATCTLLGAALTWWNGQIITLGPDAYSMTWEYVANETERYEKYISGLPDNIYGNVKSSRPKTLDETIELANDLMDQKLRTYAERQTDNKRKADDSSRNNHGHQQQPFKRQNVAKVYNMGAGEKKSYGGSLPKCTKCHFHHNGPCTQKCHKCNKVGHFAHDCRGSGNVNVANAQRDNRAVPKGNGCFECGAPGHFKRDCPKLKNKDGGNGNAQGWVYAVGNAEKNGNALRNPDSNVVTGTFLLNNRYASILFDTGADRSFISTTFSSLIDIAPTPLENSYDVELADGKIVGIVTIIRGCTLNFSNHPFNIDLMPVEPGSFDVIIGMDWLR
ncbi:putative reverse transcriptase domain-containing protein, partial [Tanacetum coccineum]